MMSGKKKACGRSVVAPCFCFELSLTVGKKMVAANCQRARSLPYRTKPNQFSLRFIRYQ